MSVLVSGLTGSWMVRLAVDVYRSHPATAQGCGCGRPACRSRMHAMKILAAAVGSTEMAGHRYPLWGLLVCDACDLPLCPLESAERRRCYRSPCGCRMSPADAASTERLTYDALDRRGLIPIEGVVEAGWAVLFAQALVAVRIGAVPHELLFVWRT